MKIFSSIILIFLLISPSFAASQDCIYNHTKTLDFYNEGKSLFIDARKNYEEFEKLKEMVTRNKGRKRHTKFNRLEKTIEAVNLLNKAISQTREAKEKFEIGNTYNLEAQRYCFGENQTNMENDYNNAQSYLKKIEKRLAEKEQSTLSTSTPDYSKQKAIFLDDLIRHKRTKSAIYLIENENIDLNYAPEKDGWSFLHTAISVNATDIVKALIAAGADIDQQTDQGYTPLMLAAINGNDKLFAYLFEHNASPFQLPAFNAENKYKNCNLADLVTLAKTGHSFAKSGLSTYNFEAEYSKILSYLHNKGLTPVCNLDPVVAIVNGKKIHRSGIDLIFDHEVRPQLEKANLKLTAEQEAQNRANILDDLILGELQGQLARQKGIAVDSTALDQRVEDIHRRLGNIDKQWLKHYVENDMLGQKIIQKEVIDPIKITAQQLRSYYKEHPDSFQQPETVCARHIVVKSKEEAQRILALAKQNPENFAELAKQYSTGPTASKGGDLGCFDRNKMVEEFSTAAFALNAGEISDVVKTQFGYHIIKVTDKTPAEIVPFDIIRDNLKKWFIKQRAKEDIPKWQKALRASAQVKIIQNNQ